MNNKGKNVIVIIVFFALIAAMALIYMKFSEKAVAGDKHVTVEIVDMEQNATSYERSTNQEYLLGTLEEIEELEIESKDGPYGPMILSINGEFAEYETNGAYWAFYVNDDYCNYGVAEQPVEDGDAFQIVYTLAE